MAQKLWPAGEHGWRTTIEHVLNSVPGEHPPGERLIIYYAIPANVNLWFDVERAAQLFSRWDLVVFGQPMQDPLNANHLSTRSVIDRIHEIHPGAKVFGYVSCAVANGAGTPLTDQQIRDQIDDWQAMDVDGLLLDEFGFDYDVPRIRQNMALDYVHEKTVAGNENEHMVAMVNAWVQADAFAPDKAAALVVDPNIVQADHDLYNPTGIPSAAGPGDYTLLETWAVHTEFYPAPNRNASIFNIRARADHARHYRDQLGVKWIGGSVVNYGTTTAQQQLDYFKQTEAFARMFGADGWAVDALDYSANVANLAVVKAWPYDRSALPRKPKYHITNDWFTITRHDLALQMVGTSTAAGASTWTIGKPSEYLG